jgi:hypothetical protein
VAPSHWPPREGETVRIGDLAYTPQLGRQLNPRIAPDSALLGERRPGEDRTFFGVFVRVCNRGEVPARPTGDMTLLDAFGNRFEPIDLPAANAFTYEPHRLPAQGACRKPAPRPTAASSVPRSSTSCRSTRSDRPLALEIDSGDQRRRVRIDV